MSGFGILKTRITVLRVHFYGSLWFMAIVLTAVNFWDSNPNGTLWVPVQLYRTTRIVRLRCAALLMSNAEKWRELMVDSSSVAVLPVHQLPLRIVLLLSGF